MKLILFILFGILWIQTHSAQGRECVEELNEWKCPEDQCISRTFVCDGDPDCLDTEADEDEELCATWEHNPDNECDRPWEDCDEEVKTTTPSIEEVKKTTPTIDNDDVYEGDDHYDGHYYTAMPTTIAEDNDDEPESDEHNERKREIWDTFRKLIKGLNVPEPILIEGRRVLSGIIIWDLEISGHSGVMLDYLMVNLTSHKVMLVISFPYINIIGQYEWEGYWCTSEGPMNNTMKGIEVSFEANLDITGDGLLQIDELKINMVHAINGLHLDFEGLCSTHSMMVNQGDVFFNNVIAPLITQQLASLLKEKANYQLVKWFWDKTFSNSISLIEYMASNIKGNLRSKLSHLVDGEKGNESDFTEPTTNGPPKATTTSTTATPALHTPPTGRRSPLKNPAAGLDKSLGGLAKSLRSYVDLLRNRLEYNKSADPIYNLNAWASSEMLLLPQSAQQEYQKELIKLVTSLKERNIHQSDPAANLRYLPPRIDRRQAGPAEGHAP